MGCCQDYIRVAYPLCEGAGTESAWLDENPLAFGR